MCHYSKYYLTFKCLLFYKMNIVRHPYRLFMPYELELSICYVKSLFPLYLIFSFGNLSFFSKFRMLTHIAYKHKTATVYLSKSNPQRAKTSIFKFSLFAFIHYYSILKSNNYRCKTIG